MKALVRILRAGLVLRCCALVLCSTCLNNAARADGWLSGLNPFAAKKPAATDDTKHVGYSGNRPGLGDSKSVPKSSTSTATAKSAPTPAKPSLFSKIGSGTSNMMNKTKSLFKSSPKPDSTFKLGSQPVKPKPTETTSSWNPFAKKAPEPDPPKTASEFIGLPRPGLQ